MFSLNVKFMMAIKSAGYECGDYMDDDGTHKKHRSGTRQAKVQKLTKNKCKSKNKSLYNFCHFDSINHGIPSPLCE